MSLKDRQQALNTRNISKIKTVPVSSGESEGNTTEGKKCKVSEKISGYFKCLFYKERNGKLRSLISGLFLFCALKEIKIPVATLDTLTISSL